MKTKHTCTICGTSIETNYPNAKEPIGLTISTNGEEGVPTDPETFIVVFGFWDQNAKVNVEFCGSCLARRLRSLPVSHGMRPEGGVSGRGFPLPPFFAIDMPVDLKPIGEVMPKGPQASGTGDGSGFTARGTGRVADGPPSPLGRQLEGSP